MAAAGRARRSIGVKMPRPLLRALREFRANPGSIRNAISVIVVATTVATLIGATLVMVFDRKNFHSFGDAIWWALQTVTTVGYGDITPTSAVGRVVGSIVLVYSVAFLAVLTATITTNFAENARRERAKGEPSIQTVLDRLDEISSRLDALEAGEPFTRGE